MSASESKPTWKHALPVLLLVLLTTGVVANAKIEMDRRAGVQETLPSNLGGTWHGEEVLFCQSPACGRSWLTRDVATDGEEAPRCPEDWQGNPCDGHLHTMSLGEQMILPPDTLIVKKRYERIASPDETVFCSVVFSGEHRTSIHRPEICMVGQGHTIEKSTVIDVPLEGRDPIQVMVLHMTRKIGENRFNHSYYAYWFVGNDRETPHHHERMLWMALDRVFRNTTHRWAYIAVSGSRNADLNDTQHYDQIREVVGILYPQILLKANES